MCTSFQAGIPFLRILPRQGMGFLAPATYRDMGMTFGNLQTSKVSSKCGAQQWVATGWITGLDIPYWFRFGNES